jgi:hypothetical protein
MFEMTHYKFSRRRYDLASLGILLKESQAAAKLGDMASARWATRQARRILRTSGRGGKFSENWLEKITQLEASLLPSGRH